MIEVHNLSKSYGELLAVDHLNFHVKRGEVLGFLGPNGAGKTTTMRMLSGFLRPCTGDAIICGHSVTDNPVAAKKLIGYLPEGAPLYGDMSTLGFLKFIAAVRGIRNSEIPSVIDKLVGQLQLQQILQRPINTLSKGFRRRIGIAQAIIHDPAVLLLDEPTDGLDPNQKHDVRQLINELAEDKIVVISTHILEEVGAVCSRAMIVANGKILLDETPQQLAARSRYHNAITITLSASVNTLANIQQQLARIKGVASVEVIEQEQQITAFPSEGAHILPAISAMADSSDWPVEQLQLESGRLDEVFRNVTRNTERSVDPEAIYMSNINE